jgi:hypothetical protein
MQMSHCDQLEFEFDNFYVWFLAKIRIQCTGGRNMPVKKRCALVKNNMELID